MTEQTNENHIDITGLDKAEVLKTLIDHAHCMAISGESSLLATMQPPVEIDTVRAYINKDGLTVDCVLGKPIKVDLTGDSFDPWLYDRDHGQGRAQQAIDTLKAPSGDIDQ